MFVALLLIGDHQTYKVSKNLIGKGEVFSGVPNDPNPPNSAEIPLGCLQTFKNQQVKEQQRCPK